MSGEEGVKVCVAACASDVVTIAPVQEAGGLRFAAIGLVNMLNPGGTVLV